MKVYKDGKTLVNYATGFRAPNGIGVGPDGQVTSGDNEGTWMPKCRLNWVKPGGFYGVVDTRPPRREADHVRRADLLVPQGRRQLRRRPGLGHLREVGPVLRPAPAHLVRDLLALPRPGRPAGRPHPGRRGPFPVNFLSGIMRPRFNPRDGQLYVAGLRGWQSSAAQDACFQRVRYTGKPANMVTGLKVLKAGLEVTFTDPLDPEDATDPDAFEVEQWNYLWCSEYGSDDYSASTPDYQAKVLELNKLREDRGPNQKRIEELTKSLAKGHDEVKVESSKLSADGKTVTLAIPGLKPSMQMEGPGQAEVQGRQADPPSTSTTPSTTSLDRPSRHGGDRDRPHAEAIHRSPNDGNRDRPTDRAWPRDPPRGGLGDLLPAPRRPGQRQGPDDLPRRDAGHVAPTRPRSRLATTADRRGRSGRRLGHPLPDDRHDDVAARGPGPDCLGGQGGRRGLFYLGDAEALVPRQGRDRPGNRPAA